MVGQGAGRGDARSGGPAGQKSLVWLASYPKSGNTWLRAFLANYFLAEPGGGEGPLPLAAIARISSGDSSAPHYTALTGLPPGQIRGAALMGARAEVLRRISTQGPVNFVKTHAPDRELGGQPLIPRALTRAALVVLRNPLDVAVSFADHFGLAPMEAAAQMGTRDLVIPPSARTVAQFLGGWSDHVESWTAPHPFPVLVLRYEDMLAAPEPAFVRALETIGAPVEPALLRRAAAAASFEGLSRQEAEEGFDERAARQDRFFRAGRTGQWREALPAPVVERLRREHGRVMRRFGYF